MNVIQHQAESVDPATEPLHPVLKDLIETATVAIFEKNGSPGIAPKNDVIYSAWKMDS